MSDKLFGGRSFASIEQTLTQVVQELKGLSESTKNNRELSAQPTRDSVILEKCPSGLVGCNPAALNEASGGLLNCPTAEHLPDPLIVDHKGRFCYAPQAIKEALDGKDFNISSLHKKYSEKILEMLKDGQQLAVAVQSLTGNSPSSSYIINIYTNNAFVRNFAGSDDLAQKLAALLTKWSNSLNPYTGASFVSNILQDTRADSIARGYFDNGSSLGVRSRRSSFSAPSVPSVGATTGSVLAAPVAVAQVATDAATGLVSSLGQLVSTGLRTIGLRPSRDSPELGGGAIHQDLSNALLSVMVYTSSDVSKKDRFVKLIDTFGLIFDFEGKNLGVLPKPAVDTPKSKAQIALEFLPVPLRLDLGGGDARDMLRSLVLMAIQLVFRELFNKKESRFIPALMVLQNSYVTMREKEVIAKELRDRKFAGDSVATNEIDDVVRAQVQARREYIVATKSFATVVLDLSELSSTFLSQDNNVLRTKAAEILQSLDFKTYRIPNLAALTAQENFNAFPAGQTNDVTFGKPAFGITPPEQNELMNQEYIFKNMQAVKAKNAGFSGGEMEGGEVEAKVEVVGGEVEGGELDDIIASLTGGHVRKPDHYTPEEIKRLAKDTHGDVDAKLKQRFKELGYGDIPVFYSEKCPVYATENNQFGPNKTWVATKHPWTKCQEMMGFQHVSKEGYCYPQSAYCYPDDDLVTVTKKTQREMNSWIEVAKIYNSMRKNKYDEFIRNEIARLQQKQAGIPMDDPAYLSDKEIEDLAMTHLPEDLKPLSEYGAVTSLVLTSEKFNEAVSQITGSGDEKYREEIRQILFSTNAYAEEWASTDAVQQQQNLTEVSTRLQESAKACTDASILAVQKVPAEILPSAFAPDGVNAQTIPGFTEADNATWQKVDANKCEAVQIGDQPTDLVLMPTEIKNRIDPDKLANGQTDPVIQWWRDYYGKKASEQAKKMGRVFKNVSPFQTEVAKPHLANNLHIQEPVSQQEQWDRSFKRAVQ